MIYGQLNNNFLQRFIALIFLLILSPLLLVIGLLIFLSFGKPPIIKQLRSLTLESNHFYLYKFRTLYDKVNMEISKNEIFEKNISVKPTNFLGKFLRLSGFDEVPQLLNIVKGEMSFIGPRPFLLDDLLYLKNKNPFLYNERVKLSSAKPGLTGYWQIIGKREFGFYDLIFLDKLTISSSLPGKIKLVLFTIIKSLSLSGSDAILTDNNYKRNKLNKFILKTLKIKREICHVTVTNFLISDYSDNSFKISIPTNMWSSHPFGYSTDYLSKKKKGA